MNYPTKLIAGLLAAAALAVPGAAQDVNPVGTWQLDSGESRFEVSLCGDGTQLCAELVWVHPDARDEDYAQFLGQPVAAALQQSGPAQWRGRVTLEGRTVNGTVRMINADTLRVTGCVMAMCDSVTMVRV